MSEVCVCVRACVRARACGVWARACVCRIHYIILRYVKLFLLKP